MLTGVLRCPPIMGGRSRDVLLTLTRNSSNEPWGFSLVGGADLKTPLIVTKVSSSLKYISVLLQHIRVRREFALRMRKVYCGRKYLERYSYASFLTHAFCDSVIMYVGKALFASEISIRQRRRNNQMHPCSSGYVLLFVIWDIYRSCLILVYRRLRVINKIKARKMFWDYCIQYETTA